MSIQRYACNQDGECEDPDGHHVRFSDHETAIAQAVEAERLRKEAAIKQIVEKMRKVAEWADNKNYAITTGVALEWVEELEKELL